jgi:hypothetical protein
MKNTFKFEVSFDLNTSEGEKLDMRSLREFRDMLEGYVRSWSGEHGYFYAYHDGYDTDITPSNIKIKRITK